MLCLTCCNFTAKAKYLLILWQRRAIQEYACSLRRISYHDLQGNDLGRAPTSPVDVELSEKPFDLLAHCSKVAAELTPIHEVDGVTVVSAEVAGTSFGLNGQSMILTGASLDIPLTILCPNSRERTVSKSFDIRNLVKFHRTIRVPDDGKTHKLPPGLWEIEFISDNDGNLLLPMHQAEAMWMSFETNLKMSSYAMKVGVGNL